MSNLKYIFAVERNIRGAWVIYGELGVRQYYGYTKKEAVENYTQGCKKIFVYEEKED